MKFTRLLEPFRALLGLGAISLVVACASVPLEPSGSDPQAAPFIDPETRPVAAAVPEGAIHVIRHEPHNCELCRVYNGVRDATFVVQSGESLGTAVLVSNEGGLALTNAHVVGDAKRVRLARHNGAVYRADVLARDEREDLALLRINGLEESIEALSLSLTPPPVGSEVLAIGHPLGLGWTISRGILSGKPVLDGRPMLQTDAPISPGNSGGPLVDRHGHLVGIVTEKLSGGAAENLAFARPTAVVATFLARAGAEVSITDE